MVAVEIVYLTSQPGGNQRIAEVVVLPHGGHRHRAGFGPAAGVVHLVPGADAEGADTDSTDCADGTDGTDIDSGNPWNPESLWRATHRKAVGTVGDRTHPMNATTVSVFLINSTSRISHISRCQSPAYQTTG